MLPSLPFASPILFPTAANAVTLPGNIAMRWQAAQSGVAVGGIVSTIPDTTGNGYTGSVAGSPTIVSSYSGHPAFHTDGSSSALLGSAASAALFNGPASNPSGWTLGLVFMPDSPGIGSNLFGVNASGTNYMLARTTVNSSTFALSTLMESTSGNYQQLLSPTAAASTTIPNVLLNVGAPSSNYNTMNVFLNGTKYTPTGGNPNLAGLNQLHFGLSYANNAPATNPSYYAGVYFDVIIWPYALTDTQAQQANTYLKSIYAT